MGTVSQTCRAAPSSWPPARAAQSGCWSWPEAPVRYQWMQRRVRQGSRSHRELSRRWSEQTWRAARTAGRVAVSRVLLISATSSCSSSMLIAASSEAAGEGRAADVANQQQESDGRAAIMFPRHGSKKLQQHNTASLGLRNASSHPQHERCTCKLQESTDVSSTSLHAFSHRASTRSL